MTAVGNRFLATGDQENDVAPQRTLAFGTGGTGGFGGVAVTAGGQAWAVGAYTTSSSANRALIERWVPAG